MSRSRGLTAWIAAALLVTAGGLLSCAPGNVHHRLRAAILDALRPGMLAAVAWRGHRGRSPIPPENLASGTLHELTRRLEAAHLEIRRFQLESARLRDELARLQSEKPAPFLGETGLPLFAPDLLTARVLDAPASDDIERTILTLDEGNTARVALAEWVLGDDDGITIDQGVDSNVLADGPVLSGRSVFGRVATTGRFTSRIQHVSDPAFRAHARLMRRAGDRTVTGSEGLLVGAGGGVCRLELIAATEPVEHGDLVITAATIPGIDDALYLGEVQTATLQPGAAHWTITVTPAVPVSGCREVQVLRVGLHPARKPQETAHTGEGASR